MNPELLALYKKFPWLLQLHDKIEGAHIFKAEMLDMVSITRLCGDLPVGADYTMHGYLVSNGQILREVYEPDSIYHFKWLARLFKKYPRGCGTYVALNDILREYRHVNDVTHVVLCGRDVFSSSYGGIELIVYSLPQGKTMKDMLADFDALHTTVELAPPSKAFTSPEEATPHIVPKNVRDLAKGRELSIGFKGGICE